MKAAVHVEDRRWRVAAAKKEAWRLSKAEMRENALRDEMEEAGR